MLLTFLFLLLTILILTHSEISFNYAWNGFALWYGRMIPTLLPFMILSGILIRLDLAEKFASVLHPVLGRIYKCSKNVSYAIIIGFLCGFPMGAKVTADLLNNQKINRKEAEFLLAFNNNIGPIYYLGFAIPLLQIKNIWICLFGMYGIPLIYAFCLRKTIFLKSLNMITAYDKGSISVNNAAHRMTLFDGIDESIKNAVQSILVLCGYMVLFNTLNILPHFVLPSIYTYLSPMLEITGGLAKIGNEIPVYSLCMLQFGGLACIAQTNGMINGTGLSIKKYVLHKGILTAVTLLYYLVIILVCKIKLF